MDYVRALVFTIAVLSFFSVLSSTASASDQDFQPVYLQDGLYTEGWDQVFYFSDGTLLVAQFTVSNLGIGDHNAGVLGVLVPAGGRQIILKKSRRVGKWAFAKDTFDFSIARHRISGKHPDYELAIRRPNGELELRFTAETPPWQLGRAVQIEQDFQYLNFYAPLARANARYRLPDADGTPGKWRELRDGRGFAARYIHSVATDDLYRSTTRIVALQASGLRPVIYIVEPLDGRRRIHSAIFNDDRAMDSAAGLSPRPQSDQTGMLIGRNNKIIDIDTGNDEYRLTGKIEITNLLDRVDPVDLLKPYVRIFVRLLNTPIHYRYLAQYDLSYTGSDGATQRLAGQALVDHMTHSDREDDR